MFELNSKSPNTIVKFDGSGRFVEISQAFEINKVKLAFRVYDDSRQKGDRITSSIDCYLDIDEAVLLADHCVSRDLFAIARKKEELRVAGNYKRANPAYESYSGSTKNGVISRHLTISMKATDDPKYQKLPFTIMAQQGPGKVTKTGAILPNYTNAKKEASFIAVGLTAKDIVKLGIQLQRACRIYDTWIATDSLAYHMQQLAAACKKENMAHPAQVGNAYNNYNYANYAENSGYNNYSGRTQENHGGTSAAAVTSGYVANNRQMQAAMYAAR